jgi:hypothetical protein
MRLLRVLVWRPPPLREPARVDCLLERASLRQCLHWAHEDASRGKLPRAAGWLKEAGRSIAVLERALGGVSLPAGEESA